MLQDKDTAFPEKVYLEDDSLKPTPAPQLVAILNEVQRGIVFLETL